jgi:hypothetical protein
MTDFGAGPKLTQDWDFEIDETGDIRSVSGLDELGKDLAFASSILLEVKRGLPQSPETNKKIESQARSIALADVRIDRVEYVEVTTADNNTAEIVMVVVTDNEQQELVFEV